MKIKGLAYCKIIALITCLACATVSGAAADELSLKDCLDSSLANNPAVLASVAQKEAAQWRKKAAYRNFFPTLGMDYSYTYLKDETSIDASFVGAGEVSILKHNNFMMGLHVDQPLFSGYKISETYDLAGLGLKEAQAGEQLARLEIVYQTTAAYFDLLRAQRLKEVKDDEVAMLNSHLHDSQSFYDNEKIPLNDLLQSKVHLANARQGAMKAATLTQVATSRLATIMKWPSDDFVVRDESNKKPMKVTLEEITTQALDRRPELAQANYRLEASQRQIKIAKGEYLPMINLRATHNRYGGNPLVNGEGTSQLRSSDETMVGVYATWELIDWGQRGDEVNRAQAVNREVRQRLTAIMDQVSLEVKNNYRQAETAYNNIAPAELAVEQARENYRMNELRYKNQLSTDTDVLDARQLLTDTEFNLYAALYDYQLWLAALARSAGEEDWHKLLE